MTAPVKSLLQNKTSSTTDKGYERAAAILRTARALFATEGYAGLSMRAVAGKLGISLGNLQHYYPTKEHLLEAVLKNTLESYERHLATVSAGVRDRSPRERLETVIDQILTDIQQTDKTAIFVEIWALAFRHPFAAALLDKVRAWEEEGIFVMIRDMAPYRDESATRIRAGLIVALIEGLVTRYSRADCRAWDRPLFARNARAALIGLATDA